MLYLLLTFLTISLGNTNNPSFNLKVISDSVDVHREGWSLVPVVQKDSSIPWPDQIQVFLGKEAITGFPIALETVPDFFYREKDWSGIPNTRVVNIAGRIKKTLPPNIKSPDGAYLAFYAHSLVHGDFTFENQRCSVSYFNVPKSYPDLRFQGEKFWGYLDSKSFEEGFLMVEKDPFGEWRRELLSAVSGIDFISKNNFNKYEMAVSQYVNALWKRGFSKLRKVDKGLASEVAYLLTRCILTPDGRVAAAWITDSQSLTSLISILLNSLNLKLENFKIAIEEWILLQPTFFSWPSSVSNYGTNFKIANAASRRQIFEFSNRNNQILNSEDIGLMEIGNLFLKKQESEELIIKAIPDRREPGVGNMAYGSVRSVKYPSGYIEVMPPGVVIENLFSSWTLPTLELGRFVRPSPVRSTRFNLRKKHGLWELFIFCETPLFPESGGKLPLILKKFNDLKGHEAVTIFLNDGNAEPANGPLDYLAVLTLGINLEYQVYSGFSFESLEVSPAVLGSRQGWKVTITLPNEWVDPDKDGWIQFGALRSHGDTNEIETTLYPSVPWDIKPGMYQLNLNKWDRPPFR